MSGSLTCGIILAGGQSLRFSGPGGMPKALAPVDGIPVVLHVAAGLVLGGAQRIVVLSGANHAAICTGLGTGLGFPSCADNVHGQLRFQSIHGQQLSTPFELRFSGDASGTAGRLLALSAEEIGPAALLSYTDILSDAPLPLLLAACRSGDHLAMLAVRPRLPWGVLEIGADDAITGFCEKPRETMRWINGGVMALSASTRGHIQAASDMLEADVIPRLVASASLRALRHTGAWYPLDSPKDVLAINQASSAGAAPWRRWTNLRLDCTTKGPAHG